MALTAPGATRLPESAHTGRPWRIHDIAADFEVEDVWAFRTPDAGPDDFPVMLEALRAAGGLDKNPPVVEFLFAVRWKLGEIVGWDDPDKGVGKRVPSLVERLPADLDVEGVTGTKVPNTPFTTLYETPTEWASELANGTCHAVCHLGWVPVDDADPRGEHQLRMTALVRPNGLLGRAYLAGIMPFRYLIVYPALTRQWERAWRDRAELCAAVPAADEPGGRV